VLGQVVQGELVQHLAFVYVNRAGGI
jgi:hypothetical protein